MTANRLRIVSLLPSSTEIVCALGAGDELVGISHECDFPAEIVDRPILTRSRVNICGTSREIDEAVRKVAGDALSVYLVNEKMLGELKPDVVLTQDLCEVCAVSLDEVEAAVARLAHRERVKVVSLTPTRFVDILDDVQRVAESIGRAEQGIIVRNDLSARIDAIALRAQGAVKRPRVVTLEWVDPLILGGTWMPELIELAGGTPVGAAAGSAAPTITTDQLRELRPDVVLIKPCGFSLERALEERDAIQRSVIDVVGETTRIYLADGNAYFNRPGPRLVDSLEMLASCIHPELFSDFREQYKEVLLPWAAPY